MSVISHPEYRIHVDLLDALAHSGALAERHKVPLESDIVLLLTFFFVKPAFGLERLWLWEEVFVAEDCGGC